MIKFENVTKVIQKNTVIRNVTLELHQGHIYGLCGYNGCGKTMLMRLMCGLILPTEGKVLIDDKQLGNDIDFPDRTGVLIENPVFLGGYDGFHNLKFLADLNGYINDDDIRETLDRVGLGDNQKKVKKYSLGMKQRLGIAAAIMEKPEIILLDEPTNALDAAGVEMIEQILLEEKKRGALIVLACHYDQFLRKVSDCIYHIDNGQIIEKELLHE